MMSSKPQCSFSFYELLISEATRAQLRSQYCDYYLLYSGGKPGEVPLGNLKSVSDKDLKSKESVWKDEIRQISIFFFPSLLQRTSILLFNCLPCL